MKKIRIFYWACFTKRLDLPWEHEQEIEYTKRRRNAIIDKILSKNYYVMIKEYLDDDTVYIFIDDKRFTQR